MWDGEGGGVGVSSGDSAAAGGGGGRGVEHLSRRVCGAVAGGGAERRVGFGRDVAVSGVRCAVVLSAEGIAGACGGGGAVGGGSTRRLAANLRQIPTGPQLKLGSGQWAAVSSGPPSRPDSATGRAERDSSWRGGVQAGAN